MNVKDFLFFGIAAFGLGGLTWIASQWFAATFEAYVLFIPVMLYGILATAIFLGLVGLAALALAAAFHSIRAIFKKDSVIND